MSARRGHPGCLGCRIRPVAELRTAIEAGDEIRLCEYVAADIAGLRPVRVAFCPVEFNRPRVAGRLLEDDFPELDGLDEWRERLARAGAA